MKIFIDTANIDQISKGKELGVIDGVTTNPTLMSKEGIRTKEHIHSHFKKICDLNIGPISVEVLSTTANEIVNEARELVKIHESVVVKIPAIEEGIKAIKILADQGIKTNCTLIFNELQALMAMKAGATYISPFIGRLEDAGIDGIETVKSILTIGITYGYQSEIICTSIRTSKHILGCLKIGADIVTAPLNFIEGFIKHPQTNEGLEKFLSDFSNQK